MEVTLSHKIQLEPTSHQENYFRKSCGVSRFVWNWGLDAWQKQYQLGLKPSGMKLKKEFNALKKEEYPWIYEVTKYASQQPFLYLQSAFNLFFKKQSRYPKFKKKGVHDSFYVGNDQLQLHGKYIRIPKLGWIKMREALRFSGKVVSATVSRVANKWFVSLNVVLSQLPKLCESQATVGVDLGINKLATLSDGSEIVGPKPLKKLIKKLKRKQRSLSRKMLCSKNRDKARMQLAKLHYRICSIRQDGLHKLTTHLTKNYAVIAVEDLNVKGMMKNHRLARAISDMGFYEFKRQLEYKATLYGNHIKVIDRWFPSSKRCSNCGEIKKTLSLSERIFKCDECHFEIDRDYNAAINLATVSSTESQACREGSAGVIYMNNVKLPSVKQESERV